MTASSASKTNAESGRSGARVLCLDDDPMTLRVFKHLLGTFCLVVTETDGKAALALLREQGPFAVMLVDLAMPDMDGITFLAEAQKIAPETVRMLVTGNTDMSAAVAAVNQGHVFRFLTKPCDAHDVQSAVREAIEEYFRAESARRQAAEIRRMTHERQQQLIKADKLASLGVMVAGIAHEINNPVNNIMLNASLLRDTMPEVIAALDEHYRADANETLGGLPYAEMRTCLPQMLHDMIASCERIRSITGELRDASHINYEKYHDRIQVNQVIQHAVRMCAHMDKSFQERVDLQLHDPLPVVAGSQRRLEQVLINLLQNAWCSLGADDGKISVCSSYDDASGEVLLQVQDEGSGMSSSTLERVKDPFFTTRRDDGGTGLGVFIANNIIEEMGGQLLYDSKQGAGTLVTIRLPREQDT